MILYVPEKAQLLEAEIQLSDGDFTADQLLCEKMTAQLSDGDLMLDKGVFEKFEAKLGDGDLDVKELQCTDNMQLKSESGDVSIKEQILQTARFLLMMVSFRWATAVSTEIWKSPAPTEMFPSK